ncbi:MAG TPA: SpoIIE family protein phosphatase [Candidatus Eisenbacteria bacterium]|nr:SpoIIE family protein phosphatase [Candidatus Eisenbacteria bacterium]
MIGSKGPRTIPTRRLQIRVEAEERNLADVRDFIQDAGEKLLIPNKILANTKLAVDEACTNVIKHGYKGGHGFIEVVVTGNGREFSIAIRDQGSAFDLRNVKSPDLKMYVETRKRGGLGVFLMNQLMDEVRYRAGHDGNTLTMSKRLDRRGRRKRKGKEKPRRSLRFAYTLQAFGALTLLVVVAFGLIHWRQSRSIAEESVEQARSGAKTLSTPALGVLGRPEPMSIEQTLLNQSIRALLKAHPEYATARVLDASGRVWGSDQFDELFTRRLIPKAGVIRDRDTRTVYEPVVRPSAEGGAPSGWIELSLKESAINERVRRARTEIGTIALLTLLAGCVLSAILISIFVRPIQALSDTVRAIGEGQMLTDIGASGNEEIDDIARAFNEVTAKFRAAQGNVMEQERLQREMQVAQEIQQTLLPKKVPDLEGFEIGYLYRAAKEVGGDYFDFIDVDDRTKGVVVADVSGKGVPGSLVMTMIRTALRMEARGNRSASDVMSKMNTFVTEDMRKGMFVTMFYVVLDSINRAVSYASAGHNPMILYRGGQDATYFLKPKGIPVGINASDQDLFRKTISVEKLTLRQDDMLVIYTDGITEAMNPSRDQFGEARLLASIKRHGHRSAQEFADALNAEIHEFTAGALQNDDITLVAVKEKTQVEERLEETRRELFRLVEEEQVPVGEACERLRVTPSTYYRYRRRVETMGDAEGLKPVRKSIGLARASLEEEAAILEIVRAEPELGAKRILELLKSVKRCRDELSERAIYETLRRNKLNTREKRLEFAQNGSDKRIARLGTALRSTDPAPSNDSGGGGA